MAEVKTPDTHKEEKSGPAVKRIKTGETSKDTPLKIKKLRCIKKMRQIMEDQGPWSINISDISKEFFVKWESAKGWFDGILKSLDAESIDNISRKGEIMIENHLKRLEGIAENCPAKERIAAMNASFKGLETLGNWLERFGRKEKMADKIDISGGLRNKLEVEVIEIQKTEDEDSDNDSVQKH